MDVPEVRYAKTPKGVHIAYQVVGDGPTDLLMPGPGYSNIDYNWRFPRSYGSFAALARSRARRVRGCRDERLPSLRHVRQWDQRDG